MFLKDLNLGAKNYHIDFWMRMTVGYIVYETARFEVQFSVQKSYT